MKKEVVTVTTPTTETRHTDLLPLETPVRIPETVPELLELTRPRRTRRRRMMIAMLVSIAVLAASVVAITRPWQAAPEAGWTGDWKDVVAEENAVVEDTTYTGDWKDTVAGETTAYTGDWKDTITEPAPYTGDWKDSLTR